MHVMKMLVNCAGAFNLQHKANFIDTWIKDIVEGTMCSGLLPAQSPMTYIPCLLFAKFLLKNEPLISL